MSFKREGLFQELNKSWHIEFFLQGRDLVSVLLLIMGRSQVMEKLQIGRHLQSLLVQPPTYLGKRLPWSTDRWVLRLIK